MAKIQHTPGPWSTDKEYGNAQDEIYGPDGRAIGTVWTRRHARSDGPLRREDYSPFAEGVANAKLITAAPDLLAAARCALADLQGLLHDLEEGHPAFQTETELVAAIAKATT